MWGWNPWGVVGKVRARAVDVGAWMVVVAQSGDQLISLGGLRQRDAVGVLFHLLGCRLVLISLAGLAADVS